MNNATMFEVHYYFGDNSHEIDAFVRNKCEAELLGLIVEAATLLEIDADLIKEAYREGGFRDIWKAIGKNGVQIGLFLVIIQIVISTIPLLDSGSKDLEIEEKILSIEEKKLNIEKLKRDLENGNKDEAIERAAAAVCANLKVIKRKSNFFSRLEDYRKVGKVGFVVLDVNAKPYAEEKSVSRDEFQKYILGTNRLRSQEDDGAIIELISPVLKEGRYKWKGIYQGEPISFEMQDAAFRDAVLLDNIPFQHGSKIVCVLVAHRELDEVGDIKITGYSVTTVLEKTDGDTLLETAQGRKYRHAKKLAESQEDMFKAPEKK